ncbi:MAG TPA: RHS repeat-associated core domain-containing protein, partial [Mucilaginibacter sp.]|nr:RHS repeat-associated core domain-containing protein [Mucilaginibacter sp.]
GNGNVKNSTYLVDNTKSKNITAYNILNLPQTGTAAGTAFTYTYDATGQKLRKVAGTTTTDPSISFIQTEEGRAVNNGTGYDYEYTLADHLGNSRVNLSTTGGTAAATQVDDYYAFGMDISRTPPTPVLKNKYLYNKKELQEELNQYDYGARLYDPVTGRWNVIDPMAEINRRFSPYNYVRDNPVNRIDPDGMIDMNDFTTMDQMAEAAHQRMLDEKESQSNELAAGVAGRLFGAGGGDGGKDGKGTKNKQVNRGPGPGQSRGLGPKDNTRVQVWKNMPYIALASVKVSSSTDYGFFGLSGNPATGDNPYMYRGSELNSAAWTELGFVGGEFVGPILGSGARVLGGLFKGAEVGERTFTVYVGLENSVVKYVGITSRNTAVRFGEHYASGTARAELDYRAIEGATGLTKIEARIWEQNLINNYGLENLLNKINSISPKYWPELGINFYK